MTKEVLLWLRSKNSNRVLPNFIIIGVQKGGTTSLFTYLVQHPQILPPLQKQTFYFNRYYDKGIKYYKASFPTESEMKALENQIGDKVLTGEATPDYIYEVEVPKRIKAVDFEPKFILIYREPVERAISEFNYLPIYYEKHSSINDYFIGELEAFETAYFPGISYEELMRHHSTFPIISRSLYDLQYSHWLQFFAKSQFLFIDNKELKNNALNTLNQVAHYLDIRPFETIDNKKYNQTQREKEEPTAEVIERLKAILDPHFELFKQMIS